MKKTLKRVLTVFFTVILCLSQEVPVLAENAATAGEEKLKAYISNDRGASSTLKWPEHYCTQGKRKEDVTAWGYVYFGSYPQKEIKGSALTKAIRNASYDKNGNAWVSGVRYHRATKDETEHSFDFGTQTYRYFKWEKIRWRVLDGNGTYLALLADQALDSRSYHYDGGNITWEKCTLRKWLNENFYQTAFTSKERTAIATANVTNAKNAEYGTKGGKDTSDKVYILSLQEATYRSVGFCEGSGETSSRQIRPTDYACAMGADKDSTGCCEWWLRSPGHSQDFAANVDQDGRLSAMGWNTWYWDCGCVPMIWVKNSSSLWKEAPLLLKTPTGLKAKLSSGNAVKLTWKKVKGASSYKIYRYEPKDEWAYAIKTVKGTTYTDKKVKNGKTYCYYVVARNGTKASFCSKEVRKKILGKLATPKMRLTVDGSGERFTISWNTVKNASQMEILRATGDGAFKKWKTVSAKKKKVSYPCKDLKKGQKYRFALKAYYKADGKKIYSNISNVLSIKRTK